MTATQMETEMAMANKLTDRQKQVLIYAANGLRPGEMAPLMGISPATARVHLGDIRRRLGARTIAHAVAIAIMSQMIDPHDMPPTVPSTNDDHREPHLMTPAGLLYDARCLACRRHGSWREGVADLRL